MEKHEKSMTGRGGKRGSPMEAKNMDSSRFSNMFSPQTTQVRDHAHADLARPRRGNKPTIAPQEAGPDQQAGLNKDFKSNNQKKRKTNKNEIN